MVELEDVRKWHTSPAHVFQLIAFNSYRIL